MDIKTLQYYVVVCDEGKLTSASERLFISKQALSSMIGKMEEETGVQLLTRTRYGVEMTPEGNCLYEYARRMIALWEETMLSIGEISKGRKILLRVGFGYLSYNLWSGEVEKAFFQENPDIELQLVAEASNKLILQMEKKQIDVMVTGIATDELSRKYRCETLVEGDKRIWMMEDDRLAKYGCVHFRQLQGRVIYCFEADRAYMMRFQEFMRMQGVSFEPRFMPSGNILASVRVLHAEHALLMLSEILCGPLGPIVGLTSRTLMDENGRKAPGGKLSAIMPEDFEQMEAAQRFARFMSRQIKQSMAGFA